VVLVAIFIRSRPAATSLPTATLPDGTQIIVQAVTYGTNHNFVHGSELLGKIQKYIPFTGWLPPALAMVMSTGDEFLIIWHSAYNPRTRKYLALQMDDFSVIDEHGCVFPVKHFGGNQSTPRFSVSSAYVRVFPRRQKKFAIRLKFSNHPPVDFEIANPLHPLTVTEWDPEPLPRTRKTNNLAVTLTALRPNAERSYISADFNVHEDGVNRNQWYSLSRSFSDATGNNTIHTLCPHERAWKVELEVFKTDKAPFPESAIWHIPNMVVPASGEVRTLTNQHQLAGLKIELMALCGSGDFSFSNDVCLLSAPWEKGTGEISTITSSRRDTQMHFRSEQPSLLVRVDGWLRTQEMLVRARSSKGDLKSSRYRGRADKIGRFQFEDTKPGDVYELEIISQQPVNLEFIVPPPL